jgi:flagellar basal body rod protein FlgG
MANAAGLNLARGLSFLADCQAAIAHNLANVSTANFKRRASIAEPSPSFQTVLDQRLPSVRYQEYTVWQQGMVHETGNRFNIAIDGPYFFRVQGPDGKAYFTRDGEMKLDDKGRLVNHLGYRYLDQAGQEIVLQGDNGPPGDISISPNGTITDTLGGQSWGPLAVASLDESKLQPMGSGLYVDTAAQPLTPAPGAPVKQGYLEGSNVDSLQELVRMITVQRSFTATQKALGSIDRMQEGLATNLLR